MVSERKETGRQGLYDSLIGITHPSPLLSMAWLEEFLLPTSVSVIFVEQVTDRMSNY